MKRILPGLMLLLAACSHFSAKEPPPRSFGNWEAAATKDKTLCYAGAAPVKSIGKAVATRGMPYLMVTRRAPGKLEISASSGYDYMHGSDVSLAIDGRLHHLFFKGSVAWARGNEDRAIINAIKAGSIIEVRGVSQEGKTSIDTYSPHGFWQAIAGIGELCP